MPFGRFFMPARPPAYRRDRCARNRNNLFSNKGESLFSLFSIFLCFRNRGGSWDHPGDDPAAAIPVSREPVQEGDRAKV
jgi:hypothetical protein